MGDLRNFIRAQQSKVTGKLGKKVKCFDLVEDIDLDKRMLDFKINSEAMKEWSNDWRLGTLFIATVFIIASNSLFLLPQTQSSLFLKLIPLCIASKLNRLSLDLPGSILVAVWQFQLGVYFQHVVGHLCDLGQGTIVLELIDDFRQGGGSTHVYWKHLDDLEIATPSLIRTHLHSVSETGQLVRGTYIWKPCGAACQIGLATVLRPSLLEEFWSRFLMLVLPWGKSILPWRRRNGISSGGLEMDGGQIVHIFAMQQSGVISFRTLVSLKVRLHLTTQILLSRLIITIQIPIVSILFTYCRHLLEAWPPLISPDFSCLSRLLHKPWFVLTVEKYKYFQRFAKAKPTVPNHAIPMLHQKRIVLLLSSSQPSFEARGRHGFQRT